MQTYVMRIFRQGMIRIFVKKCRNPNCKFRATESYNRRRLEDDNKKGA